MFESLLIANRGAIACRVIRTARRLGLRTLAVHSEADAGAPHVRAADVALPIGRAPASESYLCGERILEVARAAGADAIHPGYGFLSENADFAEACAAAGLVFVGPSAESIRAMGQKDEAKRRMQAAGVPVVPGYHGEAQQLEAMAHAYALSGDRKFLRQIHRMFQVMLDRGRGMSGRGSDRGGKFVEGDAVIFGGPGPKGFAAAYVPVMEAYRVMGAEGLPAERDSREPA